MLNLLRRTRPRPVADVPQRADLQIRNLLDDPRLRQAMGLSTPDLQPAVRPQPRFDRRRLLDEAAA